MNKENSKAPNGAGKKHSIDEWFNETLDKLDEPEGFGEEVYKNLPDFFCSLIELFAESQQQNTALFCSLILLSGVLPNYHVVYDGEVLDANLFGYLYGSASSGKGVMRKCKQLLMPIHKEKKKRSEEAFLKYNQQLATRKGKKKKVGKVITEDVDINPNIQPEDEMHLPPSEERLFLSGNNTKSNIYVNMAANKGMIMCEPEAMTLTAALKQEHGLFTDLLLQAFHHETFSYSRKSERTIEIDRPLLSVLLSSTPRHIVHFFGDAENGLYSRFVFYRLSSAADFRNPFIKNKFNVNSAIDIKAKTVKKIHDYLSGLSDVPLYFKLTAEQANKMFNYFRSIHKEYKAQFGEDMDGVVKRYGLIFTRLTMILSIFRVYEEGQLKRVDEVICCDSDFNCALSMIETLFGETLKVYEMLAISKRKLAEAEQNPLELKIAQQNQFVELYNEGYSLSEIAKRVLGNAALKPTVWRQLKKLGIIKGK